MRKFVAVVICVLVSLWTGLAAAGPPLELPALTRVASKLSGLAALRRIRVVRLTPVQMQKQALRLLDRDYPYDQQAYDQTLYRALGLLGNGEALRPALIRVHTRGVRGLYDPVKRTLYVRAGRGVRDAVLHELVHALQDQAFNLRRVSALRSGRRDPGLAAVAAVEGHATFATRILGGRIVGMRALASHSGSNIGLFLGLEHEFPYTTGASFIATLHNLGGNKAVFSALRGFPETTKQIFHVDAFLADEQPAAIELPSSAAGFSLARGDTFGELDVRALLATFGVPRLDHVGDGWAGGRSARYRSASGDAVVLALAWESDVDASQWAEAVATYVNEAFDADVPGFPATTACTSDACWSVAGRAIAFDRAGMRTSLVIGPSVSSASQLAAAIDA